MSISATAVHLSLGVCLQLASAAEIAPFSMPVFVPVQEFTLAWDHSIEKLRWEEDYEVILSQLAEQALKADFGGAAALSAPESSKSPSSAQADRSEQPVLLAKAARIKGSAAGMEPPEGAVFSDGWYHYRPPISEHQQIRLTRSEFVPDYQWCDHKGCRSLAELLPSDGGVTLMWACQQDSKTSPKLETIPADPNKSR